MPNYTVDRLTAVDRNVLRVATWELFHLAYIPPVVTINEAIEIAKKYATAESGRFVNGVLGTMLKRSPKRDYDPKTALRDPEFDEPGGRVQGARGPGGRGDRRGRLGRGEAGEALRPDVDAPLAATPRSRRSRSDVPGFKHGDTTRARRDLPLSSCLNGT